MASPSVQQLRIEPDLDVYSRAELSDLGYDRFAVRNRIRSGRWRMVGLAIATHPMPLPTDQQPRAALLNCGPHALLTSFTAAETSGLQGWDRPEIHVAVPRGTRVHPVPELPIVVHSLRNWRAADQHPAGRRHRIAPALVRAASSFAQPRSGFAILAAAVQQRLVRPDDLLTALEIAQRTTHRRLLIQSVADIAMGAHALSEIDFVRLCRRHRLPAPDQQAIRTGPDGRRRYLDAQWLRRDGRRVVAEVDGAVHLQPLMWMDDQLRQNEIVLEDCLVLRFPAITVRTQPQRVADQLRRALTLS